MMAVEGAEALHRSTACILKACLSGPIIDRELASGFAGQGRH